MSITKDRVKNDIYESRFASRPDIQPRKDPVVYGDLEMIKDRPLALEQLNFYKSIGFLMLDQVFSQNEVDSCWDEVEKMKSMIEHESSESVIREPGDDEIRSIFSVHAISSIFDGISRDRRLLDIVRQLLGSEVYLHQSRINLKPGFSGKEFYWHSDFETWHMEDGMPRMRAVSCSIALTENTEFNGPLMLVPGSHQSYVSCVGETPDDHFKQSLKRQEYGVPDNESVKKLVDKGGIFAAKGRPGSVVFFDCNIQHGSNSNITPFPRSNVFYVFNSIENKLQKPFSNQKPRPEYIASRNFIPLKSSKGSNGFL